MSLTYHEKIGCIGRGCYGNASDLSATSRACRARRIWKMTRHMDKWAVPYTEQQTPGRPIRYSWNSMGPTPTPTGTWEMRLSCNFVNVYTIAYRAQYTCTYVHARIPNRQPRQKKRACRTSRRTSQRRSSCMPVRLVASWTVTPTSAPASLRGSQRGCPCRCLSRSHGIPA